jgi:hypothetical protein
MLVKERMPYQNLEQILTSIRGGGNFTERALTGYQNVTGRYNIRATYCTPDTMPKNPIMQVLTHGLGNDLPLTALSQATNV